MLSIRDLEVTYGDFQVLWGIDLDVREGEIIALLGPNGAGKSTVLNAISALVPSSKGTIEFYGERIDRLATHQIIGRGIAHVLERRRLFPHLTVGKNLKLGASTPRARAGREQLLAAMLERFPMLRERDQQYARTLSGGEQQVCAIARGLMSSPRLLMIDEPLLGLAPRVVTQIVEMVRKVRDSGVTVLFIEQNVQLALSLADRGYVLESGRLIVHGRSSELLRDDQVRTIFLGV